MGAPRNVADRERLLVALRAGATRAAACAAARWPRQTFYDAIGHDPAFLAAVEEAEAEAEAAASLLVRKHAAQDWRAAAWWLEHHPKTKAAWRTLYRTEISGPEGGPIPHAAVVFSPDRKWLADYARGLAELPPEIADAMVAKRPGPAGSLRGSVMTTCRCGRVIATRREASAPEGAVILARISRHCSTRCRVAAHRARRRAEGRAM